MACRKDCAGSYERSTRFVVRNKVLVATVALTVAAAVDPAPGKRMYRDCSAYLLVLLFACLGLTLRLDELREALTAGWTHASIQAYSLIVTPLVFYVALYKPGLARLLVGNAWICRGLMATCCLPAPTNTHVMFTMQCGGDESVAAINAALGNIAGAVVSPVTAALTVTGSKGGGLARELRSSLVTVAAHILAPLLAGILVQVAAPSFVSKLRSALRALSTAVLVAFLYLIFCSAFASGSSVSAGALVRLCAAVTLLHLAIFVGAWAAAAGTDRRPEVRVAYVLTASEKTESLGVAIIASLFRNHDHQGALVLPIIVYHTVQMIVAATATPYLQAWLARHNALPSPLDDPLLLDIPEDDSPREPRPPSTGAYTTLEDAAREAELSLDAHPARPLLLSTPRTRGSSLDDADLDLGRPLPESRRHTADTEDDAALV